MPKKSLKIISWNVNGIRAVMKKDFMAIKQNSYFTEILDIKNNLVNKDAPIKNIMITVLYKGIACEFQLIAKS